jgi:tripartite-type tricarboxylate transporter receptor subunit TctC
MQGRRVVIPFLRAIAAACAISSLAGGHAVAQSYPAKPVRVIVAFAPGGGADIVARLISQHLSERWGQQFVVDNRAGAGGIVGTEMVARAAPDGYTLLLGQSGPNAINPSLYAKLPYDAIKDFSPITQATLYPYVIALHPSVPASNLSELIALAKSRSGELTYASAGLGSSAQLAVELLMRQAQIQLNHIPYKGAGPALMDTVAGQVSMVFGDAASATQQAHAGKVRAIAVTGAKRSPLIPDVPTVSEAGLPGYEATAWHGFLAPAGTPRDIIDKLHAEIVAILKLKQVSDRLARDGIEAVGNTPEQFGAHIRNEIEKWGKVVRDAGIKLE